MLGTAQQHRLLNRHRASAVLCQTTPHHQLNKRNAFSRSVSVTSARGVRPVSAATVAGPGTAAAAAAAERQQRVTTAADPKAVIQGTPLKNAKLANHYDAIVIGSGIGGLATAVALSKYAGQRMLVLEQHYTAGGFTHAFARGPYAWNVGVHYIGGGIGRRGGEFHALFNSLTNGGVTWAALPPVYDRIIIADRQYDLVAGRDAWLQQMTQYFPKERKALERVLALMDGITPAMRSWQVTKTLPSWLALLLAPFTANKWRDLAGQTSSELFGQLTQDQELQALLAGQYVDIGLPPGRSSAAYQLLVMQHYLEGGYLPVGGASSIAAAMIPIIEAAGGAVVTSAGVQEVLVRGGKASGVRLESGQEITSDVVISNAGVVNTFSRLLPGKLTTEPSIQQQLAAAKAVGPSISASVLYLGVKGDLVPEFSGLGNIHKHHSTDLDGDFNRYAADPNASMPCVFVSCCDAREKISFAGNRSSSSSSSSSSSGGGSSSEGHSTLQVATISHFDAFERWAGSDWRKRGPGYKEQKQQLQQQLMEQLGAVFPSLPSRIAYAELSTPLSTEYFSGWPRGAMYGLNASPLKYKLEGGLGFRYRTPIPGLFLCGQDAVGCGVAAALASGMCAAVAVAGPGVEKAIGKEKDMWQ